ncbi:hypothetical protein QYM36_014036 [Artemia franciscana]|uniref:Uncharacterized protein n=1 Tax=Artemia franciscana TaxID=6661 RepID=A0AA88HJL7_ARTSF|nr:hypothetical protein QYM36_014036 [Artemia franciscana]
MERGDVLSLLKPERTLKDRVLTLALQAKLFECVSMEKLQKVNINYTPPCGVIIEETNVSIYSGDTKVAVDPGALWVDALTRCIMGRSWCIMGQCIDLVHMGRSWCIMGRCIDPVHMGRSWCIMGRCIDPVHMGRSWCIMGRCIDLVHMVRSWCIMGRCIDPVHMGRSWCIMGRCIDPVHYRSILVHYGSMH